MNTITLFISRGMWIARFSNPEVVRLLGTCDMPTPFTDAVSAGEVAAEIATRNPFSKIITQR